MDVAAVLAYVQTLGNPLTLAADDQNLPAPLRDLLTSMPDRRLTLVPGLHLDGPLLRITGPCSASWPVTGFGDAAVAMSYAEIHCGRDDQVSGTLQGALPLNSTVKAPVAVASAAPTPTVDGTTARGWTIALRADTAGVTPVDILLLGQAGTGTETNTDTDTETDIVEPPGWTPYGGS